MNFFRAMIATGAISLSAAMPISVAAQSGEQNWSNLTHQQIIADAPANPFPNAIRPAGSAQEQANSLIVLEFYDRMINRKDFSGAAQFIGQRYNQHELEFGNDQEGLGAYIADLSSRLPMASVDVKRVVTDGEYVFLHSHFKENADDLGSIAGDIFRLEHGKIVERWSVRHVIPENPHPENPNGVFAGGDDGSRRD
jgi:predicted SnoaL-like aldol condensation-catalyzing enzyme